QLAVAAREHGLERGGAGLATCPRGQVNDGLAADLAPMRRMGGAGGGERGGGDALVTADIEAGAGPQQREVGRLELGGAMGLAVDLAPVLGQPGLAVSPG